MILFLINIHKSYKTRGKTIERIEIMTWRLRIGGKLSLSAVIRTSVWQWTVNWRVTESTEWRWEYSSRYTNGQVPALVHGLPARQNRPGDILTRAVVCRHAQPVSHAEFGQSISRLWYTLPDMWRRVLKDVKLQCALECPITFEGLELWNWKLNMK